MACFEPVQDTIGNVPPAMHDDVRVLAALYAVIYSTLSKNGLGAESDKRFMTDRVFEEIFRREATAILNRCDRMLAEKDAGFCQIFESNYSSDTALGDLATYVNQNYERQEYRDL